MRAAKGVNGVPRLAAFLALYVIVRLARRFGGT